MSVLGETHELFPDLESGPGFGIPMYESTDYSPVSVNGFQVWLSQKYSSIDHLNHDLAATFPSFNAIIPPSKDIHTEKLSSSFDHIDAAAAGTVPIYGWINDARGRTISVRVYLDGEFAGVAQTGLSRTDVSASLQSISNPNVGFHLNLNYRNIAYGIHTLEVFVISGDQAPLRMAKQALIVTDREQSPSLQLPFVTIDAQPLSSDPDLVGHLDGPVPQQSLFYNPLAELWLQFRNQVVRNYVTQYAQILAPSCIPSSKIFSHQIAPSLYGGWNRDLLAADASQQQSAAYNQGTTLYGGTAFGDAFLTMKQRLGWEKYSVSEMHPMVPLTSSQYLSMFEMHRTNGAVFVAPYYMSILGKTSSGGLFDFLISPENKVFASDRYYRAIQNAMTQ